MSETLPQIQITTFYRFLKLSDARVNETRDAILAKGEPLGIRGLFIMGVEGINTTFCGPRETIAIFKTFLLELFAPELAEQSFFFKDSYASKNAFHDLKVKIRAEIVTLERPDLIPQNEERHLSPQKWNETLKNEDVVVIDTRNSFEYDIGHFENAINPKTTEFSEFPDYLKSSGISKDQKVLIYCTGGIRCEKAILEMDAQGFKNVYQLEGGIINYLEQFPNEKYKGECFVFDYRVAVDQNLKPTEKFRLCPHCGDPAKTRIDCVQCKTPEVVCDSCLEKGQEYKTCSKNCAHHFRMGHRSTRVHEDAFRKRNSL